MSLGVCESGRKDLRSSHLSSTQFTNIRELLPLQSKLRGISGSWETKALNSDQNSS